VLNAVQFLTIVAQGLIALPFAGVRLTDLLRVRPEGKDAPVHEARPS
jgi:hypothetical protein